MKASSKKKNVERKTSNSKSQNPNPRVLVITPEVTYLPQGMGNIANYLTAKAGGLADVSAALIGALFEQGADVHVAMPDYRTIFSEHFGPLWPILQKEIETLKSAMPEERIHLAQDQAFFYLHNVYTDYEWRNTKIALAFQREVINNIIPRVRPDLIHCNDWMTGLIPALAREQGIPCLFTVHNIHTVKTTLAQIEDRGIDGAAFWKHLYYEKEPSDYENIRENVAVDFLTSGVFSSHFVNTVSPHFLEEIVYGHHTFVKDNLRTELNNKFNAGCAFGILNAPDPSYNPKTDKALARPYDASDCIAGKMENKRVLQQRLGLVQDDHAPIFFWPSRLDPVQKGCQLLADIMYHIVSRYDDQNLQIVFVANGEFQQYFAEIVQFHDLSNRVATCDFNEKLARLAFGASDFVMMPSLFEPCGLPQMIGPIYGCLPVAHDTGGIHDTVRHLDVHTDSGNGFLFENFDAGGLYWAMNEAIKFYNLPADVKATQLRRIMTAGVETFNHSVTAGHYIELYEKMIRRPLVAE
ncbi:glycogen/starch synthase [Desulfococcaceae bacterium HSG9]|nr:glycogen/starch synthase [Desulfococcaceae bacterium HSG9]